MIQFYFILAFGLCICYGMQLACETLGGKVGHCQAREFGRASLKIGKAEHLLAGLPSKIDVWMSHGDQVNQVSAEFEALAGTDTCPYAAVAHKTLQCTVCNSIRKSRTPRWAHDSA